jgi:hypothetical protein
MMTENSRVPLRDLIEQRFDSLEQRLDQWREDHRDHEKRIRTLERREPIRNVVEAVVAAGTALGIVLGLVKQ